MLTPKASSPSRFTLSRCGHGTDESDTTSRDDALLDRRTGRVEGILDAGLLLLHLDLGGCTDVDDGHTADELGEALLELLAVVVGGGVGDLAADLLDAASDILGRACAVHHGGVVLGHHDSTRGAQVVQGQRVELDAEVIHDGLAARQDGDVFEHGLAAVAEAGSLHGHDVHVAAELVHDQRGQSLAVDVLGEDEQGLAGLVHLVEYREELLHVGDLLLVDEHVCVLEDGLHAVWHR